MAVPARLQAIHDGLNEALQALPGVFSTPQWGGRAWKLPGPGGTRRKPKLVAHMTPADADGAISISFKLEATRARAVVDRYVWIEPHSFRTLAPSGWITARVRTKRQATVLVRLLAESRALHGDHHEPPASSMAPASRCAVTRHLDEVMAQARSRGWSPGA